METGPESTLENMLETNKEEITLYNTYGIKDFNNIENADRKLRINNKYEFWVHDDLLCHNSDYFALIFGKKNDIELSSYNTNQVTTTNDNGVITTNIVIPQDDLFIDVMFWLYSKDSNKLKKAAKTFQPFLYLLSLGIFLKMKEEYFEILLSDLKFEWKAQSFENPLWSRTIFTFPILERIVRQMNGINVVKITALLSWLKVINPDTKEVLNSSEVIEATLVSHDLFYVRNFIKRNKLMITLTTDDISFLKKSFPKFTSAFDSYGIINNFIVGSRLMCIVCKKEFESQYQLTELNESKCKVEDLRYHPRCQLKSDKMLCCHEGCRRKFCKGEYQCCHKKLDAKEGCQLGDGKHIIVICNNDRNV